MHPPIVANGVRTPFLSRPTPARKRKRARIGENHTCAIMKYCSACGATVVFRIPPGDTLPRHVCAHCGTIHYQNPKMVVGALAEWEDKVLLCRRAIEPRLGMWTLPAG